MHFWRRLVLMPLLVTPVLGISILALQAQSIQPDTVTDLAQRASEARDNNQLNDAIILYRAALAKRPSWAEGWWNLGSIQYKQNNYSMARESFRHVAVLNPKSGQAFAFMGLCDFELGRYVSALTNFNRGGTLGFGEGTDLAPLVLYRVALLLSRSGDFERSLDQLSLFVVTGNHSPEIVEALGLGTLRIPLVPSEVPARELDVIMKAGEASWQFHAHNVEDAKKLYEELISAYPKEPNVHYAYGMYLLDSDPQLAFEEFNKELSINSANNAARLQLAFFHLQRGAPEEALKLVREAPGLSSMDYRVPLVMGRSFLQMDQPAKAVAELKKAILLAPDDYECRFYLAQAYRGTGNKQGESTEQAEFARLKQEDKRQTTIGGWWYFGSQYYQKGRFSEARDAFVRITDQDPRDGTAWAMMGLSDFQLSDYKNALEHLTKADHFGLQNAAEMEPSLHYYLAILLNQSGRYDDAVRQLSWFTSKASASPQLTEAMGINALRLQILPSEIPPAKRDLVMMAGKAAWALNAGHREEAKGLFDNLVATYPSEPNVHYDYGVCLAQLGDLDEALREFKQELAISPSDGDAESQMVLLHLKQGSSELALREGEAAVQMAPDSFLPHNVLGWALLANRQPGLAVAEMAASVRLAPDMPATHYSLAQAYKAVGKNDEAGRELARFEALKQRSESVSEQAGHK